MKRPILNSHEAKLLKRVEAEHEIFKYKMLASTPKEIYESSGIIRFYDSIYEYFCYNEHLDRKHVMACLNRNHVIAALHELYMDREYLSVCTWQDIDELLNVFSNDWSDSVHSYDGNAYDPECWTSGTNVTSGQLVSWLEDNTELDTVICICGNPDMTVHRTKDKHFVSLDCDLLSDLPEYEDYESKRFSSLEDGT